MPTLRNKRTKSSYCRVRNRPFAASLIGGSEMLFQSLAFVFISTGQKTHGGSKNNDTLTASLIYFVVLEDDRF